MVPSVSPVCAGWADEWIFKFLLASTAIVNDPALKTSLQPFGLFLWCFCRTLDLLNCFPQ
jgi:hypothetical protein